MKKELRKIKALQSLFNELNKAEDWQHDYWRNNAEPENIYLSKLLSEILKRVDISEFPISRKQEILDIDDNIIQLVWKHKPSQSNDWYKKFPNKLKSLPSLSERVSLLAKEVAKEEGEEYVEKNGDMSNLDEVFPLLHKFFVEFGMEYIQIKTTKLLNYKLDI